MRVPLDDPLAGTSYRALQRIGRGAFGEVWEACHIHLGTSVVVKVLRGPHFADGDQEDRLRLEAQALARLRHPNVVHVFDFGRTNEGRPYFVMERLEGRTLDAELTARFVLPVDEAVAVTRQLLTGLGAVHAAGVVHRDVKPGNVFYTRDEPRTVKLLDLGLAKLVGPQPMGLSPIAVPTAQGRLLGTPRYCAPEQARGGPIDARTDVYAVGLVLYRLLAGCGPFDEQRTLVGLVKAAVYDPPAPPSEHAPQDFDERLDGIVLRALAKRPEDRFGSAAEMCEALDQLGVTPSRPSAPSNPAVLTRAGTEILESPTDVLGRDQVATMQLDEEDR